MKHSRDYEYYFPFAVGTEDLDGSTRKRGLFGFGVVPCYLPTTPALPMPQLRPTGWRPIITSIGYQSIGVQNAYTIRLLAVGSSMEEAGLSPPPYWHQVILEVTATRFYLQNIPIPMSEVSGNPYSLQIHTTGRQGASFAVCDWEWGRYVRDYDATFFSALAERTADHGR